MSAVTSAPAVVLPPASLKILLTLAWPVILARSTQAVIGFTDALMTAPLGLDALAAVTTGALNVFAVIILPMGVVFIVQSFAAQLSGKGDPVAARRYGIYGLLFAGASGLFGLAVLPFVPAILGLLELAPGVAAAMTEYVQIRVAGVGLIVAVEALGNWYGGLGNTKRAMRAGILAMVVNVALNYLLIEGHLGAPALGVAGAALASTISSAVAAVYLLFIFLRDPLGKVAKPALKLAEALRMLRFGLPSGFNWLLEFSAFAVFINVFVADLGTSVLAAMMVVFNVNSVSFMPAFGLSSAGAILVGQAIGAKKHDEVPGILKLTAKVASIWQVTVGMLYFVAPSALMVLFADPKQTTTEMITIGATMLMASAGWQLFDALAMAVSEALRAAGDTAFCLWARLLLGWVLFVPSAYLALSVMKGGPVTAILCVILYMGALAAVLGWRFKRGNWRKIDLAGVEPQLV